MIGGGYRICTIIIFNDYTRFTRGHYKLNEEQVEQPDKDYDWKILKGKGGAPKDPRIG